MPRVARLVVPNCPHHVIQRGHNRQTVFAAPPDYRHYLANLWEWKKKLGCKIYAYCLMTNHVHLLIDPGNTPENLGKLMKRVAGRQTRYVNSVESRTGTLWEGRYKSSPVETNEYLLVCSRYIELNPVRARLVGRPQDYPWSSYGAKVGEADEHNLDLDPCYLALGDTSSTRIERYRQWAHADIPQGEWSVIRQAVQAGHLTGNDRFKKEIEAKLARRINSRLRGRPPRQPRVEVIP